MTLRMVEIVVPVSGANKVNDILKDQYVDELPNIPITNSLMLVRFILEAEEAEAITDKFRTAFSSIDGFRINIIPLEATIPVHKSREEIEKDQSRESKEDANQDDTPLKNAAVPAIILPSPTQPITTKKSPTPEEIKKFAPTETIKKTEKENNKEKRQRSRVSKDELYADLNDAVKINYTYIALVILSVVVAAVGLVQNNIAVIIGAMVIAPLLAPNVALSLSTTLADRKLAVKALKTLSLGLIIALGLSFILGIYIHVDPEISEIALRTNVGIGDVIVGLAAGAAAALFFGKGMGTALVGVMVAAAILPPLVVTGLLLGTGEVDLAIQSLLLLISNLIGINLACTAVFIMQGVWPSSWWEEKKAKRTALSAMVIWIILFLLLVSILLVSEN